MPHVATSPADLLQTIRPAAHLDGERLVVDDETAFRATAIRDLAWTAAFSTDETTTAAAQWLIWEASQELGAPSASIQDLYTARARGEVSGFTVPAINLRAQTFDLARTIFETAMAADVGAVILEIARSEQTYTYQRPIDFATSALAGAIAAGWRQPVFLQGDHYQFNTKKYAADPESMTEEIRRACRLAIDAGYR
ncbi:MAG: class II fructose-bisphosphate aldolase, partial [Candidatus Limnocylindrales bacterium]